MQQQNNIDNKNNNNIRLSIVWALRNDNYQGQTKRFEIAGCVLLDQLSKFATSNNQAELILVDWNPPQAPDHDEVDTDTTTTTTATPTVADLLFEACPDIIQRDENRHVHLRSIVVPSDVTQSPEWNPENVPFLEFIAKNVGIRRARGSWILANNPDDLHVLPLIELMMNGYLDTNFFYRLTLTFLDLRTDPGTAYWVRGGPMDDPVEISNQSSVFEISDWLASDRATTKPKTVPYGHPFIGFCDAAMKQNTSTSFIDQITPDPTRKMTISTEAAGDFTLASREAWHEVGGYPEVARCWLDGTVLMMFRFKGYEQLFLPLPCGKVFHQQHGGGLRKSTGKMGVEYFQGCLKRQAQLDFEEERNATNGVGWNNRHMNAVIRQHRKQRKFANCVPEHHVSAFQLDKWADHPDWGLVNYTLVEVVY